MVVERDIDGFAILHAGSHPDALVVLHHVLDVGESCLLNAGFRLILGEAIGALDGCGCIFGIGRRYGRRWN